MRFSYLSQATQISFAFAVILSSAVFADTITWTGTTSSDWNTTSNWSSGAVPTATDDVIIIKGTANLPTIDADYSVNTLTLKTDAATTFKSMAAGYYAAKDFKAYTCLVSGATTTYADFTDYLNAGSTKGISTTTDATGTRYFNNSMGSTGSNSFYYISNKLKDNNGVEYTTSKTVLSNEPTMGDVIVNQSYYLRPGDYAQFSDGTKYHMYESKLEANGSLLLVSSDATVAFDQQMTYAYRDLVLNGGSFHNGNYPCIVSGNITLQSNSAIDMADGSRKRTITLDNVVMKSNNSAAILTIKDHKTFLGTLAIQNSDFSGFNGSTIQLGDSADPAGAVVLGGGVTGTDKVNWKFVATTADKCYIENSVAGTFKLGAIESAIANADIRAGVDGAATYEIGGLNKDSSYAGKITDGMGTVSINKTGTGTLTLSGTSNTYTGGTTVSTGTLALTGTTNLNNSTSITNNAAITAQSPQTFNNLSGTENTASISIGANVLTLNNTADSSYAGTITGTDTSVTKTGDGELILSGVNGYEGATTIIAGTLKLDVADAIESSSSVINNAAITFTGNQTLKNLSSDTTAGTRSVSGTGDLTLDNNIDTQFVGNITGTTISFTGSGKIKINGTVNGSIVSSGASEINLLGTLESGDLTISSGSTFSPGNSIGDFILEDGDYTLESGATHLVELDGGTLTWDKLFVTGAGADTGTVTLEAGSFIKIALDGVTLDDQQTYELISSTGDITNAATLSGLPGWELAVLDSGATGYTNGLFLQKSAEAPVPEPSTWALLILSTLGFFFLKGKKRVA